MGYKVHLSETCEEDLPSIITQMQTTKAIQNDNEVLPQIHQALAKAALLPDRHLVDAGYIEATQLVESRQEYGMALIGPVQGNAAGNTNRATALTSRTFVSIGSSNR